MEDTRNINNEDGEGTKAVTRNWFYVPQNDQTSI
jgi:hypothetical protein